MHSKTCCTLDLCTHARMKACTHVCTNTCAVPSCVRSHMLTCVHVPTAVPPHYHGCRPPHYYTVPTAALLYSADHRTMPNKDRSCGRSRRIPRRTTRLTSAPFCLTYTHGRQAVKVEVCAATPPNHLHLTLTPLCLKIKGDRSGLYGL